MVISNNQLGVVHEGLGCSTDMKFQKVYLLQQSQALGNPTQCLQKKVKNAEPLRCH